MNLQLLTGLLILTWRTYSQDISQKESEIILNRFSTYSLNCSAKSGIAWKHDESFISSTPSYSNDLFTNTLTLHNVTGLNTGMYTCIYNNSTWDEEFRVKSVYIFVPDPTMWFLPIKENDEFLLVPYNSQCTIPCRVTNPNLTVTLHEKAGDTEIPCPYDNKKGFTGYLEDMNYYCKAFSDGIEVNSDLYYIFSLQGSDSFPGRFQIFLKEAHRYVVQLDEIWQLGQADGSLPMLQRPVSQMLEDDPTQDNRGQILSALATSKMNMTIKTMKHVVKKGEEIKVTCTVFDNEIVNITWNFPGKKEGRHHKKDLDMPNSRSITSILTIPTADLEDSGNYTCHVEDGIHGDLQTEQVEVHVIEKGFVNATIEEGTEQFADLHQCLSLKVSIIAYPEPTIEWLQGNIMLTGNNTNQVNIVNTNTAENMYSSYMTLVRVKEQDGGPYTLRVYNEDDILEIPFHIQINVPVEIKEIVDSHPANGGQIVTCVGKGMPMPYITWFICTEIKRCNSKGSELWIPLDNSTTQMKFDMNITYAQPIEFGSYYAKSVLHVRGVQDSVLVRCAGENGIDWYHHRDVKLVPHYLHFKVVLVSAILTLVVLVVIFFIILVVLWQKKPRYEIRWKVIESVSSDGHEYIYVDPLQLPYDSSWEISRDKLVLGRTLGSGAFGRVVEATAHGLGHAQSTTKVAVKMLKSTARSSEKQALMSELKIMSHLGPHLNIVNLLAACTKGGPIYIVTEYCRYGDLVDYLHRNKHTFLQYYADKSRKETEVYSNAETGERMSRNISVSIESDGGYMDMSKDDIYYVPMLDLKEEIKYAEIEPSNYGTTYELENYSSSAPERTNYSTLINESPTLSFTDLIGFSYQVANGMDFLASKNCVHRDLAARNVLICEGKLVKICDFGLARDIVRDSNYISKGNTFLPLKWMAPESIFNNLYTTLSDVWSFGILLWEIFTLGGTPYPELPMNEQFYNAIKRGYRMSRPSYASEEIYEIMQKCWDEKFEKRPSFSNLVALTGNLLSDGYKQRYKQADEEFLRSDHPAVVRVRPRAAKLNNAVHVGESISNILYSAVQPIDSDYIIPLPDPKPEDSDNMQNDISESRPSSTLQEGNTSSTISCDSPLEQPEQEI